MDLALRSQASSSSSFMANSTQPCYRYDVFLSFRGDTRKAFTDHLYNALKKEGIDTFRDDDAMERGKLLKPELEKAIQQSAISLIVFSKDYASSKWCLDEVLMIMEQHERSSFKHEVVPVFYDVEPTDVRNQTGCFKEAFNGYDDRIKAETDLQKKKELLEKVKAWRGSLNKAGALTGMVLGDGYEAQFITNIVKDIRKKLDYNALYIKEKLVGIRENVAKIESWLQNTSPNSTVLLIHGMGGIGKTTIASCTFNLNCHEYDGSCFLADINEQSNKPNGLLRLQSQLLSQIKKSETKEKIWNFREGTTKVIKAICSKRILLVLDDITTSQQLDALLGEKRLFPGSKVMITTRDKSLLNEFEIHPRVHAIKTLCNDDSIKLFSLHAFHKDQPLEPYLVRLELVNHYCMGLPLALQILGSYLRGKSIDEWDDAMHKLEVNPLDGIQKVLELSYESLDNNDKNLFLHIACFFKCEDKDNIVKLLAACNLHPIIGIKNLVDRCLIYVEGKQVGMHQLIREMGQEVVRQESPKDPGKRTRLWRHEDCTNVLQENEGTEKVEGLMLDMKNTGKGKSTLCIETNGCSKKKNAQKMDNPRKRSSEKYRSKTVYVNEENFNIGSLEKMKNLMLLQLNYATISGNCNNLPKKLRLLRWHGFPLKSIPCDIPMKKLVVLDMSYSKLKRVWDGYKFIGSLKVLNLSYCDELMKTPDFRGLHGLERLILKGCKRLTKVDESVADLKGLLLLDITYCINLRELPYLPASLVLLEMSGCPNLGVVGGFRSLDSTSLPCILRSLDISNCNLFDNSFPEDWSNLVSLESLNIDGNHVTVLPKCIQSLPTLTRLSIKLCSQIQSIIGVPTTVRSLSCHDNESLEKVRVSHKFFKNCKGISVPTSWELEGFYKCLSMDKVEKKILEKLWLGSSMELDTLDYSKQKVSYENGIFSTLLTQKQIPNCSSYMYKAAGPQISFRVPWNFNDSRVITSFNMCLVLSNEHMTCGIWLDIQVYNKTKDLLWIYTLRTWCRPCFEENVGWVSLWRCGNLLDHGDEIFVNIVYGGGNKVCMEVEECCINLIYEEENKEQDDDEEYSQVMVSACDGMAWSDRMFFEISDCVHKGKTYKFGEHGIANNGESINRRGWDQYNEGIKVNGLYELDNESGRINQSES